MGYEKIERYSDTAIMDMRQAAWVMPNPPKTDCDAGSLTVLLPINHPEYYVETMSKRLKGSAQRVYTHNDGSQYWSFTMTETHDRGLNDLLEMVGVRIHRSIDEAVAALNARDTTASHVAKLATQQTPSGRGRGGERTNPLLLLPSDEWKY